MFLFLAILVLCRNQSSFSVSVAVYRNVYIRIKKEAPVPIHGKSFILVNLRAKCKM